MDLNRLNDKTKLQIIPDESQLHSDRSAILLLVFLELKVQTCKIDKATLHCGAKTKSINSKLENIQEYSQKIQGILQFLIYNIC